MGIYKTNVFDQTVALQEALHPRVATPPLAGVDSPKEYRKLIEKCRGRRPASCTTVLTV